VESQLTKEQAIEIVYQRLARENARLDVLEIGTVLSHEDSDPALNPWGSEARGWFIEVRFKGLPDCDYEIFWVDADRREALTSRSY